LNDIIEARMDEIIANIKTQLEISGFSDALGSGIIITGGGAALKSLSESIEEKTKQKVRIATVKEELIDKDFSEYAKIPGIEETVGLLSLGTEDCIKPKEVEKPVIQPPVADKFDDSLFPEGEIEVVEKNTKGGKRKLPETSKTEKEKGGFFSKLTQKVEKVSRGLFDGIDSTVVDESDEK